MAALQHARRYARHICEVGSLWYQPHPYSAALSSCCYPWCGAPVQVRPILPIHPREAETIVIMKAFWVCGSHPGGSSRLASIAWDLKFKYEIDVLQATTAAGFAPAPECLVLRRTRVITFDTPDANRAYPNSNIFFVVQWTDSDGFGTISQPIANMGRPPSRQPPPKRQRDNDEGADRYANEEAASTQLVP